MFMMYALRFDILLQAQLHDEAYELYSHYDLAKGHCICTGLGFGVRENWFQLDMVNLFL